MLLSEDELIAGCLKGRSKAQEQLYESFSRRMLVVCMRYSKARQDAEDILQEAFIKVFKNLHTFRRDCPLEAWIKRIVVFTALKHNRSKWHQQPAEDVYQLAEDLDPVENPLSQYHFQELLGMIQKLPVRCQLVFNLYAIEGYQHNEIAQMLEISEGTSKSQYARARQLLQSMLQTNTTTTSYGQ
jgi:RNA polymerase sigma factor (sigma-70 family)